MIKSVSKIIIWFSCTILFFSGSAYGEYYYRYTDQNGTLHFTDNLDEVPVNQRVYDNKFNEIKRVAPTLNETESENNNDGTGNEQDEYGKNTISEIQALNKEKRRLEAIHEKLFSKITALKKERTSAKTPEAFSAYQEKVTLLNKEITDYEKQREAFDLKLKRFNEVTRDKGQN